MLKTAKKGLEFNNFDFKLNVQVGIALANKGKSEGKEHIIDAKEYFESGIY